MIKLADFVARFLADHGIRNVFLVTGGGAMHLNDAIGREPRLHYICNHHEQACAMAAEGYARISGRLGVINVTTGPGGINAMNGVFGAWTDSIPMLVLSGQVKRETCLANYQLPGLRQLGDQEADIISMVKGITKYAIVVTEPASIRYHLEKALFLAISGRPGPCWLDIPIDVQASQIDENTLKQYDPAEDTLHWDMGLISAQCAEVLDRLKNSPRPAILAGSGIRAGHALDLFESVTRKLGIPVTTAWTHDLIASDDPLYCGRPGTIGTRAGNFTVQNTETLLVLGSRLNIRQVSYNWQFFARNAYKIQVDVDSAELNKPTVQPDLGIHCDLRVFLKELNRQIDIQGSDSSRHAAWLAWCKERVAKYPVVLPRHRNWNGKINPYHFLEVLFQRLADDDIVVVGNGAATVMTFQAASLKRGQRLFGNSGSASMGFDLPAAIGAAFADVGRRVICLAGDGSFMLNLQELQTVAHHKLPLKIFILNNDGYLSIRTSQSNFFGRMVGESPKSGVSFPDMVKLAQAFDVPGLRIDQPNFTAAIDQGLNHPGPILCDVILDPQQTFEPKLSSKQLADGRMVSAPLEDMFPFLDREELLQNLLVSPIN